MLRRFILDCWTFVIPMVFMIDACLVMVVLGYLDAAQIFSQLGTFCIIIANVLYIVFWHSRKRWPRLSAWSRFVNFITFTS